MLHHIFLNITAQLQSSFNTSSFVVWRLCCSRLIRFKWRWVIKASSSESGVLTAVCGSKMEESQCFMSVTSFWRLYAFKNKIITNMNKQERRKDHKHMEAGQTCCYNLVFQSVDLILIQKSDSRLKCCRLFMLEKAEGVPELPAVFLKFDSTEFGVLRSRWVSSQIGNGL